VLPKLEDPNTEALDWWRAHKADLPLMSQVARSVLCIPASSASSERAFSMAGQIVNEKRTNLDPKRVEMLAYIKENFDRVKLDPSKLLEENSEESDSKKSAAKNPNTTGCKTSKQAPLLGSKPSTSASSRDVFAGFTKPSDSDSD